MLCSGSETDQQNSKFPALLAEDENVADGACGNSQPLSRASRVSKRCMDILVSSFAIVLLSPLMVLVAILIKFDDGGPILFRQQRIGRRNSLFYMYKFRSMRPHYTDIDGTRSTLRNDRRITRIGRVIRSTSIDELPQLLNVWRGEMSLVGPRPHALGSLAGEKLFWEVDSRYLDRHALKPGMTGLAQIRGLRGTTESENDLAVRLRSDLEYISSWSLLLDLKILLRTTVVLVHRNAY